ncbi:uroporphyrinogen-III synthase [Cohaesibacter intestini]|uniref:uroporphyrinogen-III synthase n=1 Tax=Cohaesibacter intestini TaxID=2211145 RepID=UPI001300B801|nr:uroporphyrinogen-III synthase [Cohaesibacter intestini]
MRILVTRPALDQDQTCKALRALGIEPVSAPVMEAQGLQFCLSEQAWQAVVVTSRNGLRMLEPAQIAQLRLRPLYCVGAKTESLAHDLGFETIEMCAPDLAVLTPALVSRLNPAGGPVLYLTGRHRTGSLKAALETAGLRVEQVESYDMVASPTLPEDALTAIRKGGIDGVLLYSQRSSQLFLSIASEQGLEAQLGGLTFYCLSPAIATLIKEAGYPLVVADAPNEKSLLASLEKGRNYLI